MGGYHTLAFGVGRAIDDMGFRVAFTGDNQHRGSAAGPEASRGLLATAA